MGAGVVAEGAGVASVAAGAGVVVAAGAGAGGGALPLTTGTGVVTSSRRQIEIAQEWGTNVWYVRPEYSTQLAKVARDELKFDLRDLKTKFLGCGLGPDTDGAFAKQIEDLWGCPVYDMYGTHEMGMGSFELSGDIVLTK